jgi:hypothetical protein
MPLPNIFSKEVSDEMTARIHRLTPQSQKQWGKMDVARMLAHCCVTYEMIYEPEKHPKPNFLFGIALKLFAKRYVTNEKPLKKNGPTGPQFIISDQRAFESEKQRLIEFIERTRQLGEREFDGRVSASFGPLTSNQWNNMFYKHLNHHLEQFGV